MGLGADRFFNSKLGYYTDVAFLGYPVGSGWSEWDPQVNTIWRSARIMDDPVKQSNARTWSLSPHRVETWTMNSSSTFETMHDSTDGVRTVR